MVRFWTSPYLVCPTFQQINTSNGRVIDEALPTRGSGWRPFPSGSACSSRTLLAVSLSSSCAHWGSLRLFLFFLFLPSARRPEDIAVATSSAGVFSIHGRDKANISQHSVVGYDRSPCGGPSLIESLHALLCLSYVPCSRHDKGVARHTCGHCCCCIPCLCLDPSSLPTYTPTAHQDGVCKNSGTKTYEQVNTKFVM